MYAAGIKGTRLDQSIQLPKRWRKCVKNRERREKPAERWTKDVFQVSISCQKTGESQTKQRKTAKKTKSERNTAKDSQWKQKMVLKVFKSFESLTHKHAHRPILGLHRMKLLLALLCFIWLSINQSINVKFVGRRYTRRPGAPTVVSGTHDQKVHSWVVFWMYWYR